MCNQSTKQASKDSNTLAEQILLVAIAKAVDQVKRKRFRLTSGVNRTVLRLDVAVLEALSTRSPQSVQKRVGCLGSLIHSERADF